MATMGASTWTSDVDTAINHSRKHGRSTTSQGQAGTLVFEACGSGSVGLMGAQGQHV